MGPRGTAELFGKEKNYLTLPEYEPRFIQSVSYSAIFVIRIHKTNHTPMPNGSFLVTSIHQAKYIFRISVALYTGGNIRSRAESWTMNKEIDNRLDVFEREVVRRIRGGIKVKEIGEKQRNKELMQLFGYSGILSLVRVSLLNWIGYANRMNRKRKSKSSI